MNCALRIVSGATVPYLIQTDMQVSPLPHKVESQALEVKTLKHFLMSKKKKKISSIIVIYFVLCLSWTLWMTRFRNVSKLELQAPVVVSTLDQR